MSEEKEEEKPESEHNIRTFVLIGLILVGIISAGCAVYWWGTGWELPGSNDASFTAESDWVNYTNPKLGFSFMYPANWSSEISKEGYLIFKGPTDDKGQSPNLIVQVMLPAKLGGSYSNADDAASDMLEQQKTREKYTLISYSQTRVCNESAREIVYSYSFGGVEIKQSHVFVQDTNTGYIYMICYTATEESYQEYVDAFEKAKETFKFGAGVSPTLMPTLTPTPMPGWRTYIDRNLNFSLMYPANWSGEISKEGYLIFKGRADDKGHSPNVIVQAMLPAKLGGNYSDTDDAASDILEQLKTRENYTLISYQQTEVCNENAREMVCSYSYGGLEIKQGRVFVQDSSTGYIYMICYTATEGSYSENLKAFEKAKETFELPG